MRESGKKSGNWKNFKYGNLKNGKWQNFKKIGRRASLKNAKLEIWKIWKM